MKFILAFTFVIALFSTSYSQHSLEPSKIDSIATRHMAKNHIPGMALAIIKNGNVEKIGYYGISDIEANTKVDDNTVFEIASMTKQITCAAILLLQEDRELSIKDKFSKYFPGVISSWKDITIEQLMNHTSGLRDDWDEPTSYFQLNSSEEKMSSVQQAHPLLFDPGTGFEYSSGPFFLGLLIEKITGKPYSSFLKERIFDKLGMLHTSVYDSTSLPVHLAKGYRWENGNYLAGVDIPAIAESRADVGLITTVNDMIKWSLSLDDNRLLNDESLRFMFSPGKLKTGKYIPYSAGWYISFFRGQRIFEHGGAFRTGFNSWISRFPNSKTEIIILCNKWKAGLSDLAYELETLYDRDFSKVSEIKNINNRPDSKDGEIKELLHDLSVRKYDIKNLYKNVNASGYDPDELRDLLKGFSRIECIGKKYYPSKSFELFGSGLAEVLFYKVIGEVVTYWSFAYDEKGKLICVNPED